MKLSFDVGVFAVLIVFCGAVVADPQSEKDKKSFGLTGDPTVSNTYVITPSEPCQKGQPDTFLTISGGGKIGTIVTINECTGHVTVAHPERMNEQGRQFWLAVQQMFPSKCRVDIERKKPQDASMHGKVNSDSKVTRTPDGGLLIKGTDSK